MLATRGRVAEGRSETLVWHKPVGDTVNEFQAIACSDTDGIVLPAPKQDVPLDLDKPGERWCPECLALITDRLAALSRRLGSLNDIAK
ncbi:hypothetical protein [Streptomyces sp. NBC_00063]|uniref:hypothetical protein n=1 Tax=Streptomyces sp. NBC_00063 TaxID=2975638 RepID=UPI003D70C0FD